MFNRLDKNKLVNFCFILLIFAPVLSNYKLVNAISIGDMLVVSFMFGYLALGKIRLVKYRLYFFLAFCVLTLYTAILFGLFEVAAGFYRLTFFMLLTLLVPFVVCTRTSFFWTVIERLAFFFSVSLILQFVAHKSGYTVSLQLPIEYYEPDTLKVIDHVFRSGGWFKEPSYFALFLTPVLIKQAKTGNSTLFGINTIAAIISTSSLTFFILIYIFINFIIDKNKSFKLFSVLISVFMLGAVGVLFTVENTFSTRLLAIFFDGGTLNERVLPIVTLSDIGNFFVPDFSRYNFFLASTDDAGTWLSSDAYNKTRQYGSAPEHEGIWFSSGAYVFAIFGFLGVFLLLLGMTYVGFMSYCLLVMLLFSTHILSGAFVVYLCVAFSIIYADDKNNNNKILS